MAFSLSTGSSHWAVVDRLWQELSTQQRGRWPKGQVGRRKPQRAGLKGGHSKALHEKATLGREMNRDHERRGPGKGSQDAWSPRDSEAKQ